MDSIIAPQDYLGIRPSPFVEIKKDFRAEICKRIKNKYKGYKGFSRAIGMPYTTIYNSILEKSSNRLRLDTLCSMCKMLSIEQDLMFKNILEFRPKRYKNLIFPNQLKPSKQLASLIGHALGDGHISKFYAFSYTNTSRKLQYDVMKSLKDVFDFDPKPTITYHKAYTYNYPFVVGAVLSLSGACIGDKTTKVFDVPSWIKNGTDDIKAAFLSAVFDDEACVKINGREIVLKMSKGEDVHNHLVGFFEAMRSMLFSLGIEPSPTRTDSIYSCKKGRKFMHAFGIHGQKNFIRFRDATGFKHPQKAKALDLLIKNCKTNKHRAYEAQNIILDLLERPLPVRAISAELEMSPLAAYKNLRKLEKRNLVAQVKYPKNTPSLWTRIKDN